MHTTAIQTHFKMTEHFSPVTSVAYNENFDFYTEKYYTEDRVNNSSTYQRYLNIQLSMWKFTPPFLIVLGLMGNSLSFIVLRFTRMRNSPVSVYLAALAVTDNFTLLVGLLRHWVITAIGIDMRTVTDTGCKIHVFLTYCSPQLSAWILVAVSVERALSFRHPFKHKEICSKKTSFLIISTIIAGIGCLNIHLLLYYKIVVHVSNDTIYQVCSFVDVTYEMYTYTFMPGVDFAFGSAIPSVVLLICNLYIIHKIRRRLRMLEVYVTEYIQLKSVIAMLITVSLAFLLLSAPLNIFLIGNWKKHWDRLPKDEEEARVDTVYAVVSILFYLNHVINFLLYCVSGSRFRDELTRSIAFSTCRNAK